MKLNKCYNHKGNIILMEYIIVYILVYSIYLLYTIYIFNLFCI